MKKTLFLFLFWRMILFVPIIIAHQLLKYRNGYEYTSFNHFLDKNQSLTSHFLLIPWANFDGVYYLLISVGGYTANAGFFPLFPILISVINSMFSSTSNGSFLNPVQYILILIFVNLVFLLGLIFLFKLIKLDYKNNIAVWSIIFMLVFPSSFFYASVYSESLFLLLSILTFYFARTNRWLLASIFAGLLTATRFVGISIIPALIYEFIKKEKTLFKFKSIILLISFLGILTYMIFNYFKWGSLTYFIQAQGNFNNERSVDTIVFIPQTIFRYSKILLTVNPKIFEWWIALLEIVTFIFVLIMLFVAWRKKIRLSYILFAVLCFLVPVLTGTFSGLPRYALILFPIFIALAMIKNKFVKIAYSVIGFTLLLILLAFFSKGYYIA